MTPPAASTPRVRFAPSPTGYLHVGGARTALFNWLFARRLGGTFVLRIEDTDMERSSAEMVTGILDGLRWLGLDWDEGPEVGGPHAPYFQSERLDRYRAAARDLVTAGQAYYDFGGPAKRGDAAAEDDGTYERRYDREACLAVPADEVARRLAAGEPYAIRFLVPAGETVFADLVHGPVRFDNAHIEDFVVLRSDGYPTYHLSVVVDDMAMAISHVVRGDDHISNTPKQVLLYQAFGHAGAALRARAAHHGRRQEAAQQAPRRHLGDGVRAPGLPARGHGELPGPARLVARQRRGAAHHARAGGALHARGHQHRQRRVQHREVGLVQSPVPDALDRRRPGGHAAALVRARGAVERRSGHDPAGLAARGAGAAAAAQQATGRVRGRRPALSAGADWL